jgi:arylsulfatase A
MSGYTIASRRRRGRRPKRFPRPGPAGRQFEAIDVQTGITDHTIAYIGEKAAASKEGKPFFTYVPLAAPHTPIVPAEKWQGTSGINPYADFVRQVDSDVGRILDALKENGIAENTIVIFTADNGCSPSANLPELQKAGHSPSYIFRGHKADLYEGGHRVPFVVRWPAKVKAGTTSDQLIGQIDFLATFAELVGAEIPAAAGEDSVSFLPVLLGTADKAIRTSIISQSINGNFAIRDGQWKLALCPGSGGWSFPKPGMDDTTGQPDVQLYQLEKDPGEKNNLAAEYPDRVVTMTAALEKAISEGRTTPGPEAENDVAIVMVKPTPPAKKKGQAK